MWSIAFFAFAALFGTSAFFALARGYTHDPLDHRRSRSDSPELFWMTVGMELIATVVCAGGAVRALLL